VAEGGWEHSTDRCRHGRLVRLDGMSIEVGSDYHVKIMESVEPSRDTLRVYMDKEKPLVWLTSNLLKLLGLSRTLSLVL
jgi:hypothetical protein